MRGNAGAVAVLALIAIELLGTACRLADAAGVVAPGHHRATWLEGLAEIGLLVAILVAPCVAASRFANSLTAPWLLAPACGAFVLATYYSHIGPDSCATCRFSAQVPNALGWIWGFAAATLLVGGLTLRHPRLGLAVTALVAFLALGTLAYLGLSTSDG